MIKGDPLAIFISINSAGAPSVGMMAAEIHSSSFVSCSGVVLSTTNLF